MWYNPLGKEFSNSTHDPSLGFTSLKTINPKAGGGVQGGKGLLSLHGATRFFGA